jgi:hypothetical protein
MLYLFGKLFARTAVAYRGGWVNQVLHPTPSSFRMGGGGNIPPRVDVFSAVSGNHHMEGATK